MNSLSGSIYCSLKVVQIYSDLDLQKFLITKLCCKIDLDKMILLKSMYNIFVDDAQRAYDYIV